MNRVIGDIFSCPPQDAFIVVPTNVGWTRDGRNVMGAGVAKVAAKLWPELPVDYGKWCQNHKGKIYVDKKNRIICLPSKPLNAAQPWASWRYKSDPTTIRESFVQLREWVDAHPNDKVKLPLFGAGNGGLRTADALRIVQAASFPESVFLVLLPEYK